MMRAKFIIGALLAVLPTFAFAQELGNVTTFLSGVTTILDTLLPILVTLAVLAFFWGLAKFIFAAGDESAKAAGKNIMIWGIIALFIIVSIWGIVGLIGEIFGIGQGGEGAVPGVESDVGGGGTAPGASNPGGNSNPGGDDDETPPPTGLPNNPGGI